MRNEINGNLISNIEISEDMKKDIYQGVRRGRSNSDFRFRHSGALMAALIAGAICLTGAGASAAAIFTFSNRLEEMPKQEKVAYTQEVKNDTFVSTDEGFSRELTEDEIIRSLKLERDYYDKGVFPKQEMAHYEKADERAADELAYVAADNMVYLPDEMTDEQMLQYIDHDAKKRYVNIEQLKKDGVEPGRGMALESTPVKEGSAESKAITEAKKLIRDYYGDEVTDKWIILIDRFDGQKFKNKEKIDVYHMFIYQLGLGYATDYEVSLNADDMSVVMLNRGSFEDNAKAEKFTPDEAEKFADEGEKVVVNAVEKLFGFKDPKKVSCSAEACADEDGQTSSLEYTITYPDKTKMYVAYQIDGRKITGYTRG